MRTLSPATPVPDPCLPDLEAQRRQRLEALLQEQRQARGQVQPTSFTPPGLRRGPR